MFKFIKNLFEKTIKPLKFYKAFIYEVTFTFKENDKIFSLSGKWEPYLFNLNYDDHNDKMVIFNGETVFQTWLEDWNKNPIKKFRGQYINRHNLITIEGKKIPCSIEYDPNTEEEKIIEKELENAKSIEEFS